MTTRRFGIVARTAALTVATVMALLPSTYAAAQARHAALRRALFTPKPQLPDGWTQLLTPEQWKQVETQRAKDAKKAKANQPAVRVLTKKEMSGMKGRGLRFPSYAGTLPWHRSFRDVNLCNGNLFKSFTDIQVAPAKGAGLALQRTYNSSDDREGAFGVGWTHAYDIRLTEETAASSSNEPDKAVRSDFFDGKHKYSRDADGLYTPPPYLFDELDSQYGNYLTHPFPVTDDQITEDGTVKHFSEGWTNGERVCDWIKDRYGNTTTLSYTNKTDNGVTRRFLDRVTDPTNSRYLQFYWVDLNNGAGGINKWRIVQVDGPTYSVVYRYDHTGVNAYNLSSVIVDATATQSPINSVAAIDTPLSRKTSFEYTSVTSQGVTENGLLWKIVDPLGHTSGGAIDPNGGHVVSYGYEVLSDLTGKVGVSSITEPSSDNGSYTTVTWNIGWHNQGSLGGGISSSNSANDRMGGLNFNLDSYGRWTRLQLSSGGTTIANYDTHYNAANQVDWTSSTGGGELSPYFFRKDKFEYGKQGQQTRHEIIQLGQNDPPFPSSSAPAVETTTYYNASRYFQKETVTDAAGRTTRFYVGDRDGKEPAYSSTAKVGNRGSVLAVQGPDLDIEPYVYTYNSSGQKLTETNANGVVTKFTYGSIGSSVGNHPTITDGWGNLTQVVQDTTTGATESATPSGYLNRRTRMAYDASGRVIASYDPAGRGSSFTYNNLGQPKSASFPATYNSQNQQVTPAESISYTYEANGRMKKVIDGRGTTELFYEDKNDRVKKVTDPTSGDVEYTYGKFGERKSVTMPHGNGTSKWTYHYHDEVQTGQQSSYDHRHRPMLPKDDPNSFAPRLVAVDDDGDGSNGNGTSRRVNFYVTAAGRLLWQEFNYSVTGTTLMSYTHTDYGYDSTMGWLTTQATQHWSRPNASSNFAATPIASHVYEVNAYTGQRKNNDLSVRLPNGNYDTRKEEYWYDVQGRLETVKYGDNQNQEYAFDSMGNRTSKLTKTDNGTTLLAETFTPNAANMLTARTSGSNTFSYDNDANGNVKNDGIRSNVWDSQNRLTKCVTATTTSDFVYGADGLRRQTSVNNGTTTTVRKLVLDNGMMLRERDGSGNTIATYLQGASGPVYRRDDSTTGQPIAWYVYDGLGSVACELNPNGTVAGRRCVDVYGITRSTAGTGGKHGFVGQLGHTTDETSLIYMRARHYDPVTGRFQSEDPRRDSNNWFAYCANNPVNSVDPNGCISLDAWCWWSLGMLLAAGALWDGLTAIGGGAFGQTISLPLVVITSGLLAVFSIMAFAQGLNGAHVPPSVLLGCGTFSAIFGAASVQAVTLWLDTIKRPLSALDKFSARVGGLTGGLALGWMLSATAAMCLTEIID